MLVEILILDTDHRFSEQIRNLRGRKIIGVLLRMSLGDQISVSIIDLAGLCGHKGILRGFTHKGIRLVLHRFYSGIVTAKIENGQNC